MRSIAAIIALSFMFLSTSCGIKGKPRAPKRPPELGRGKPTYRGATKQFIIEKIPVLTNEEDDGDKDKNKDKKNK